MCLCRRFSVRCRDCCEPSKRQLCQDCEAIQGWEIRHNYPELDTFHLVVIALGVSVLIFQAIGVL